MRRTATGSGDRNGERGATLVESMLAICFLFFLFFALLQVYHWCLQTVFCQYSAFYGSKGIALGYQPSLAMRGARIAAIAISGRELSHQTGSEEERARAYMTQGDNSGVVYEYWSRAGPGDRNCAFTVRSGGMRPPERSGSPTRRSCIPVSPGRSESPRIRSRRRP